MAELIVVCSNATRWRKRNAKTTTIADTHAPKTRTHAPEKNVHPADRHDSGNYERRSGTENANV